MSKKRNSAPKPAFDLPPVPQETRYISNQSKAASYLDGWIPDLVGADFEEMALHPDIQANSRFFRNDPKRLAIHLVDSLFIAGANRASATSLTALEEGIFFTVHLAIASPTTIKVGVQNLRQSTPYESVGDTSKLLAGLIRLQSPQNIIEAFQYEQFFIQELLQGDLWGRALFSALLWESQPPFHLLTDWQRERLLPNTPDGTDKGAGMLFIGLFASRALRSSTPNLARFSDKVVAEGLRVPQKDRMTWATMTFQEWIPLHLEEVDTMPARTEAEVAKAAEWLVVLLGRIEASSEQGTAAA